MSDEQLVREANDRFYAAMNALDIGEMDDVWLDDASSVCVHPGREAIAGYERIRDSWLAIFSSSSSMSIAPSGERVTVASGVAWVACTETISLVTEEGLAAAAAQATNIFRLTGGAWRMVLHHASAIPFNALDEWPDVIN
ncbi:MAG TPA: nuclear transport factor 2 family protein [Pyrinomonadaceae bacterium]|jgi:ketosteroid isomerase-like protein